MTVARTLTVLAVLVAVGVAACSGAPVATSSVAASSVAIDVLPRTASVGYRQPVQLNATVTGTAASAVTWAADCGSITQTGLFTAPDIDAVCNIVVRPEADTTKSASSTVTVSASTVTVSASPVAPLGDWGAKCANEPMRTTGKIYYACDCQPGSLGGYAAAAGCAPGNDANAGTSPSAPVQSWSKISQIWQTMADGDTIALCQGGKWNGNNVNSFSSWVNTSCRPGSTTTCIMRDYVPSWGSGNKPVITFTGGQSGPNIAGGPSLVQGYRFLNLALVNSDYYSNPSSSSIGNSLGLSMGDNSSDLEFCNLTIDGFLMGVSAGLNGKDTENCPTAYGHRRHFRGNRIINNCLDGMGFESHDSDIDGNYFDNNGHDTCNGYSHILNPSGGTTHTFYLMSSCDVKNLRFINNEIHRTSFYQAKSTQASIVMGGYGTTGHVIENNYFDAAEPGSTAGAFFGGARDSSWIGEFGLVVRRNRIKQWAGTAIGYDSTRNAIIEDNVIQIVGDMKAAGMLQEAVIAIPQKSEAGLVTSTGITIRNNTIYVSASNGSGNAAIAVAMNSGASNFNVTGNAIYATSGLGSCFNVGDKSQVAFMNNNLCYGATNWTYFNHGTNYSLANWRSFAGFDSASLTLNPLFVNSPASFSPGAGSPLIGAASPSVSCTVAGIANQPCTAQIAIGSVTWSATDAGVTRAATSDIGACQR